jgi:hypothetical protein
MLQVEQILRNRYQLQRQLNHNGIRQTWLAKDLSVTDETEKSQVVIKLLSFGGSVQWDDLMMWGFTIAWLISIF